MNKRWENYGLWVALAALLGMILQDTWEGFVPERYGQYTDIVLYILIGAGIVNSPIVGKGFRDKEDK
ncbi:hypothetical protein [Priestia endophytica]|uniref:Holin n=1 Tax=Priestia endophytica TaxID=135735 RepID=A0AAX1Q822_9BACI|nr:hypothetical protein [Priestia endophytica]RAS75259.1 hypothetical protein A3864_16480 [Priestia endophytica]